MERGQTYKEPVVWNVEGDPCLEVEQGYLIAKEPGHCKLQALTSFFSQRCF